MTVPDWAKFVALHLRGDAANPQRDAQLLSAATFDRLHAPAPGPGAAYACGWGVAQRPWAKGVGNGTVLTHAGSNTLWFCVTWLAPERDFAVLVACNLGGDGAAKGCDDVCAALIERFAAAR